MSDTSSTTTENTASRSASREKSLPEGIALRTARIIGPSGDETEGRIAIKEWSEKERRSRAAKKTAKIVAAVFAFSLIGLFVHILLIVIVPTLFLTMIGSFPLYLKFKGEESTFYYVEGQCPHCRFEGRLRPYLDSRAAETVTAQCPECGQTSRVRVTGA